MNDIRVYNIRKDMVTGSVHGELTTTGRFIITARGGIEYEAACSCGDKIVTNPYEIVKRKCCSIRKHGMINTKFKKSVAKYKGKNIRGYTIYDVVKASDGVSFLLRCDNCGIETRRKMNKFIADKYDTCSCGIIKNDKRKNKRKIIKKPLTGFKDLTGQRFNKLTVIGYTGYTVDKNNQRHAVFKCKCECGGTWEGEGGLLTSGSRKYCNNEITKMKISCARKTNKKKAEKRHRLGIVTVNKFRRTNKSKLRGFSQLVYDKYNGVCQKCNKIYGKTMSHSHHIIPIQQNKKLAFTLANGILMCEGCHTKFHVKYGFNDFTPKDVFKFLREDG